MENKKTEEPLFVIQKNPTERIHANVQEFRTKQIIHLRVYYMNAAGDWLPTKKGVSMPINLISELRAAVNAIEEKINSLEKDQNENNIN